MLPPFDFAGRVTVVTGGGSGIGRAVALLFAQHGADLVLAGRKRAALDTTAGLIADLGRLATVVPTDVKQPEACGALAAAAIRAHGRIDVLVNGAGGSRTRAYPDWSVRDFDDMIALNLRSAWWLSRAVAPHIRDAGGGAIVNISSGAAFYPVPASNPYGMAKAGLNMLTATMAVELAGWGIRVNGVAPGPIKSDGFLTAMERLGADPDAVGGRNLTARAGTPDEVAWPILFLCSAAASFINGETINVSGGPLGWRELPPTAPHA